MNSSLLLYFILVACLVSSAAAFPVQNALDNNKATIWFQKEYNNYFKPNIDDGTPPIHLWSERKPFGPEYRLAQERD